MNNVYGVIYCALNVVNNKRYIGQTIRGLDRRKNEHLYQSRQESNFIFHKAINKYGEDLFEWSVIDTADNHEELDQKELYWIEKYNTYGGNGYNMTVGGQFAKITENNRDELSLQSGGRAFLVFDLNGTFIRKVISQTVFAQEIGVGITTVNNVLLGIKNSTKDMILIFEDEFSEDKLNEIVTRIREWHREFTVFDVNGEFVGMWNNKTRCAKELKAGRTTLVQQLNDTNLANRARKLRFYYTENIPKDLVLKIGGNK